MASAYVFVPAAHLGVVPGVRTVAELNGDRLLLDDIEIIRGEAARLIGTVERVEDAARLSPVVPRIVLVAPTRRRSTADLDVVAVSMGAVHRALPMTAALCLAAAARTPGTVVEATASPLGPGPGLRVAHPLGEVDVFAEVESGSSDTPTVRSVGVVRTARRLMSGMAFPFDEDLATVRQADRDQEVGALADGSAGPAGR